MISLIDLNTILFTLKKYNIMKTKKVLFTTITLLLLIGGEGCETERTNSDIKTIIGTWKLEEFGNTADNSFKEVEPKDCEECFILTFHADSTFTGKSIINRLAKNYYLSGSNLSFPNGVLETMVDEITGDGTRFTEALRNVHRYSIEKSKLKLFYSDTKYLLFYPKL